MAGSNFINLEKYSKIIEQPYLKRNWAGYNLGSGYGRVYGKRKKNDNKNFGRVINTCPNLNIGRHLYSSLNQFKKNNWYDISSFFIGIIVFCYNDIKDKISYVEMDQNKYTVHIRKCCENLTFPTWAEDILEEIWASKPNFDEYLKVLYRVPRLNFDLESAHNIYHLQGKKAIFGILAQIYTLHHQYMKANIKLIPGLPVENVPVVSDFVSGVFFPVVATKFSNKFHWEENDDGSFLIDEFGAAIDCVKSGAYTCANDPLFNRLGFVYRSGKVGHNWHICWNWGELVEAVRYYGGDILVRGLSETFLRADWRRFGVNGLVSVNAVEGKVAGSGYTWRRPDHFKPIKNIEIDNKKNGKYVLNLMGSIIDVPAEGRVVYSNGELEDWFELGRLCQS